MKTLILNFLLLAALMSCEENDCCNPDAPEDLLGTWLNTEVGYSPGAGYIVEPVNPIPPQTITLEASGEFQSTVQGLEDFKFYQIIQDASSDDLILALFNTLPPQTLELDELTHSYNIVFEDGIMKLYFRFCFEGCHLGFSKTGQ